MPTTREINPLAYLSQFTGFDPQGGYAVINDAGKLFANAMAEYEARSKSPRNDIYGRILPEDTDAALKSELIDPILYRFGLNTLGRPGAAAKTPTYHVGDALVQVDPMSGKAVPVYNAPAKPEKQPIVSVPIYPPGIDPKIAHVMGVTPTMVRGTVPQVAPIAGTNMPSSLVTAPAAAPVAPVPAVAPPMNSGFIGLPGGTNLFQQAVKEGKKAVENPAGGSVRQVGRFTIKSK